MTHSPACSWPCTRGNVDCYSYSVLVNTCTWCRYWWMYAINFILYLLTLPTFRSIYSTFLSDCLSLRANSKQKGNLKHYTT